MQTATCMKATGSMTSTRALVYTVMQMEPSTKDNGSTISSMAQAKKPGPMVTTMRVASWKAKSMVKESKFG